VNWEQYLRTLARRRGLDEDLAVAQIGQESNFDPSARSPAGARGIAQIMPGTAAGWHVNPDDPKAALQAYVDHMADYVKQYGTRGALIAYNAGPGRVGSSHLPQETTDYINKIMGAAGRRGSVRAPTVGGHQAVDTTPVSPMAPQNNIFSTLASFNPVNVQGTTPAQQQLQQTTQQNWQLLASLLNQQQTPAQTSGGTSFDVPDVADGAVTKAKGVGEFEGKPVASWIAPILQYARAQGWKGGINSGYRSDAEQKRIYDSGVRPAAKPRAYGGGGSNHEFTAYPGGAVDVSDAEQLAEILRRSKYARLLVWAGSKDPVHFSHPHNGSY
jgi:hypothetical protein